MSVFLVAAGGFLGAVCRYVTSLLFSVISKNQFPVGTLAVNLIGSLLLGFFIAIGLNENLYAFTAIGFLSSFTTFSTFSVEMVNMIKAGEMRSFVFYLIITYIGGIIMATIGLLLSV
jgi:fluoride exporter